MLRFVLILAAVAAAFLVLRAAGVLLVFAAIGLVVAFRRREQVAKVRGSRGARRLPLRTRTTPMRLGVLMTAVLITATACTAASGTPNPAAETQFAADSPAASAESSTLAPSADPTARPTSEPTPVPTPVFGREPTGPTERARVTRVIDGDTIEVLISGESYRVRYIGIDTPETHNGVDWLGPEASRANARLVDGRSVILEKDVSETDRYGRLLRYVWLRDGSSWLLVNAELLRQGFAQIATYPPDVKYVDELYRSAQHRARDHDRGLWGPTPIPQPTPPPAPTAAPSNCHPSYRGACLKIGVEDYDCLGGSGNGPYYTGPVEVIGYDEYGLDYDHDGFACETS